MMQKTLYEASGGNLTLRQLRQMVDSRPLRGNSRQLGSVKAVPEWEKAWSDTVRKAKEGLPKTDERPTDSAPKFAKPGSQGQQYVKDQESQLLNIFTQEKSFQLGGGLILGLLVLFALAGPP